MAMMLATTNGTIGILERASAPSPYSISAIQTSDIHLRESQASSSLEDPIDDEPLQFKTNVSTDTDSGYASALATPNKPAIPYLTEGVAVPSRKLFNHRQKLSPFDIKTSQPIKDRFLDLSELFNKPLFEHLTKSKAHYTAISFKLKVLGVTEATAKPWFVVQCDKAVSKKVKQFFNQSHIKAEYQPHCNIDVDLPSFQVLVCSRAPRPMATNAVPEVSSPYSRSGITSCGTILQISHPDHARFATLGGIIKIGWSETDFTLYGMTAGHVAVQVQPEESDVVRTTPNEGGEDHHEDSEEAEDENYFIAEEDFELEFIAQNSLEAAQDKLSRSLSRDVLQGNFQPALPSTDLPEIVGYISHTSRNFSTNTPDLDWALIHLTSYAFCRPNYLDISGSRHQVQVESELKTMFHGPKPHEPDRNVVLLSGTRGPKEGKLSTSASYLMMEPATAFTKTYNLVLCPQSYLDAGDCGSWVVDRTTCEVYGHVVAIDAFGEIHVVPLNATFQDMLHKLGAQSVGFPSKDDISKYIAQHHRPSLTEWEDPFDELYGDEARGHFIAPIYGLYGDEARRHFIPPIDGLYGDEARRHFIPPIDERYGDEAREHSIPPIDPGYATAFTSPQSIENNDTLQMILSK